MFKAPFPCGTSPKRGRVGAVRAERAVRAVRTIVKLKNYFNMENEIGIKDFVEGVLTGKIKRGKNTIILLVGSLTTKKP